MSYLNNATGKKHPTAQEIPLSGQKLSFF